MRQRFFDATGKEKAPPDDSGGTINRAITMLKKLVPNVVPKPTPKPEKKVFVKKIYEKNVDPDTGEPKKSYDAVKKEKSKVPPRMPPMKSPKAAPTSEPAGPSMPRVPAARVPGPPPFDPSVLPGAEQGKIGWGSNRPQQPDPMPGLPPSVPPSGPGWGRNNPPSGPGWGRNRPPSPPPTAPPPEPRPNPRPIPTPQPPPIMPPVDPGPPVAGAPGGQIYDGKKPRFDGKKKKR